MGTASTVAGARRALSPNRRDSLEPRIFSSFLEPRPQWAPKHRERLMHQDTHRGTCGDEKRCGCPQRHETVKSAQNVMTARPRTLSQGGALTPGDTARRNAACGLGRRPGRGPSSPTRPPRQAPSLARLRAPAAHEAADSERGSPALTCLRGAGPVHPITFDRFRVDVSTASQTYSAQNRVLESLHPKENTHRNHSQHQTRPARRMSDRPPGRSPKP